MLFSNYNIMDILIEKEFEPYFGNFINNYYSVFINIFNKSSIFDKFLLLCVRTIHISSLIIVLVGFLLPKNLLIWHIIICFILLSFIISSESYNGDYDYSIFTNFTFTILKRNNTVGYSNEQLLKASQSIPLHNKTSINVLLILMILSILSYIYPKYSGNTLLYKLLHKLNIISNGEEQINNDSYKISQDFKLNMNRNVQQEPNNNISYDLSLKIEKNADLNRELNNNDLHQGGNNELLELNNYVPLNTDINNTNEYDINLNKVDSNISIFDKNIEQIKIIKNNPVNINSSKSGGNLTNEKNFDISKSPFQIDKKIPNSENKMLNSVKDMSIEKEGNGMSKLLKEQIINDVSKQINESLLKKNKIFRTSDLHLNLNLNSKLDGNDNISKITEGVPTNNIMVVNQLSNSLKKFNTMI